MGYDNEVYRLVLLTEREKADLIEQLKVLPGHKGKLMSLIDMIKDVSTNFTPSYIRELLCLKCWSGIHPTLPRKSNSALPPIPLILSGPTTRVTELPENSSSKLVSFQ